MRQPGHGEAAVEIAERQLVVAEDGGGKIDEMPLFGGHEVTCGGAAVLQDQVVEPHATSGLLSTDTTRSGNCHHSPFGDAAHTLVAVCRAPVVDQIGSPSGDGCRNRSLREVVHCLLVTTESFPPSRSDARLAIW